MTPGLPCPRRRIAPRFLLRLRVRAESVPRCGSELRVEAVIETPRNRSKSLVSKSPFALLVATAGGAGYAPAAPGTCGSAVGVVLYLLLANLGPLLFGVTLLGLAFLGIWASDEAERVFEQKDDGRIVIDEVVGQLLTLAPLVALAPPSALRSPPWLLAGFLLFRLFDIWKPTPVAWAERSFVGGVGVMIDDVFAGILGGLLLAVAVLWVGP